MGAPFFLHLMINFPNFIIRDKYLRVVFALSFLILLLASLISYLKFSPMTSSLIVHFDAYKGIDFLGNKIDVFGILLSALVMVLINLFLAEFLYNRERFLSYIFGFVSFGLILLILIAISVIISAN